MRKKLFTLLLAVAAGVGTMLAEKVQIGDLYYNLDATNQTAEVAPLSNGRYSGDIVIPSSVTYNSVSYSVTSIGDRAFYNCSRLTSVTIPNSVTSIGYAAFSECTGLTSVTIPNSVTSIGDYAFWKCSGLTSMTVGNSVTSIGSSAFEDCSSLTSVTIPNSVTSIGDNAFSGCSSLTSVTIPNSVTSIGNYAFQSCRSLTSVTIPNSVTSIGDRAFYNCSRLTSVTIPNSVTSIGYAAFSECTGLTSVTIPNSVTSIGDYAFWKCSGLTSMTVGNSVTSIGNYAFRGCTGLPSVTIPNSVTSIGECAFLDCTGLTSIYNYRRTPVALSADVFKNVDYFACTLYVLEGSVDMYKSDRSSWKDFFYNIEPISATPTTAGNNIQVTPTDNTANIVWPQVNGAETYELVIKDKSGNVICTLIFNAQGQLTSIAFSAPSRNNAPQQTQAAGFAFTVTGLNSGTSYDLVMTSKNSNGGTIQTKTVSFTTTGDAQGIEEISSSLQGGDRGRLILHNGQIFILRGEKVYNAQGTLVK